MSCQIHQVVQPLFKLQRYPQYKALLSTEKVTLEFFPNQDQPGQGLPEQVRVTTYKNRKPGQPAAPNNRVDVTLDKPTDPADKRSKKYSLSIGGSSRTERDSLRAVHQEHHSSGTDLVLDLGLNALVNRGAYTLPVGGQPGALDLRTWGSRYVSIGLVHYQRLGGKHSPLSLLERS